MIKSTMNQVRPPANMFYVLNCFTKILGARCLNLETRNSRQDFTNWFSLRMDKEFEKFYYRCNGKGISNTFKALTAMPIC